jgi:hypothetical protein
MADTFSFLLVAKFQIPNEIALRSMDGDVLCYPEGSAHGGLWQDLPR